MKKIGTLNSHLSYTIATMGHTDRLIICDSGLPIPRGANIIDLALVKNVPRFLEAVKVVLEELEVEQAVIATEMEVSNAQTYQELISLLKGIKVQKVPHEKIKALTRERGNVTFLRTGEATPYSNVILVSGVTFD